MKKRIEYKELLEKYGLLQALMDYIPDVIYFKDKKGKLIMVNKAHAKGLGLSPEQVIGKTDFDIFPKERAALMAQDDAYVMGTGKPIIDKVERSTRADGVDNYVSTTKIPRYDAKGRINGLIGITRDITQRMQLEHLRKEKEQFKKKLQNLEEVDRVKSEFVSVVSHELRTPLAIIKEALSLILDGIQGDITDGQRTLLVRARENAERLRKIIEELLDISRIEQGKIKLHYSLVDLTELIKSSADFFIQSAREKGLELSYQMPRQKINIFLDPERVNQIISNLLDNAFKFTERGGKIKLEVVLFDDKVRVGVFDSGIGIAKADLPRIFDKFEQVAHRGASKNKGIGLGLSIIKELVESHGGEIWAESQTGVGSKFYFTLPRLYTKSLLGPDIRQKINVLLGQEIPLSLIHVLIVNFREFNHLMRMRSKLLVKALNGIILSTTQQFHPKAIGQCDIFVSELSEGECSIVVPNASPKTTNRLCLLLRNRVNDYFAQHRIENTFVNISLFDVAQKIGKRSVKDVPAQIHIKRFYIGAEQRKHRRFNYQIRVEPVLDKERIAPSHTLDISEGGLCFVSPRPLKTDALLTVKMNFPRQREAVVVQGRIAWIRESEKEEDNAQKCYKIGLEFVRLPKVTRGKIVRLIKTLSGES
jgi:PAS domain S-box-containing protein